MKINKQDIIRIINNTLYDMLGYSATEALYFHICKITNKSRIELFNDFNSLVYGIKSIFKDASEFIFNEIKKRIEMTYNIKMEGEDFLKWLNDLTS